MPRFWLAMIAILLASLVASVAIASVKLITTPTTVFDVPADFRDREWRRLAPPR